MPGDLDDLELFREFARTGKRRTRNRLVERHMGLAVHIAKRYSRTGRSDDDLRQVAMIGLVKAVDRFDPDYGASFTSFAGRTIEGELKRHFRDASWTVKVPRSAKELHLAVRRAGRELEQQLGSSPSVDQIASHLEVDREDVLRGLEASAASTVETLDRPVDDAAPAIGAMFGSDDGGFEEVETSSLVERLLGVLPEREREIVRLRFGEEKTQSEIAEAMGMSQMHVSRLLRDSFEKMRRSVAAGD